MAGVTIFGWHSKSALEPEFWHAMEFIQAAALETQGAQRVSSLESPIRWR